MRQIFILVLSCGFAALSSGQQAQEPKPEPQAKSEAEAKPAEETSPTEPQAEVPVTGSLEVGYRWTGDIRGNYNVYRSVVNYGDGPRLLNTDLTFTPKVKWLDRIDLHAQGWGGDPQSTVRLNAKRQGAYDLLLDHRDMAYFSALPSFANPALERGLLFSQRSFDIQRRYTNFELNLRPGTRFIPYVAYSHDTGSGNGVTTFVSEANEYPVSTRLSDRTANVRGGVRLEFRNFHLTLEQGAALFRDDQQVFTSDRNLGNRTTPFLGQTLFLQNLTQTYGITGKSPYSKALFTASPFAWLDLYGQFMFSQPRTDTSYVQQNAGQFAVLDPLATLQAQQVFLLSAAKQPHTTATFGAEVRPFRGLRLLESVVTDRFHNASSVQNPAAADRLELNYNQQQIDILYDLTSRMTVRGGHRYVWGDSRVRAPQLSPLAGLEQGELRRHVGLAGVTYRTSQKLSVNGDLETSPGDRAYFRTSLNDYTRARVRARYQWTSALTLTATGSLLDNDNPTQLGGYELKSRDFSLAGFWNPKEGKRIRVLAEYTRSFFRSDLLYRVPQTLQADRSFYKDNAHIGTSMIDLALPSGAKIVPRLSFGGSLFASTGSRPTRFYQPVMRFTLPVYKHVSWNAEWRWYAMSERFYMFENFQGHQAIFSLRFF
jgi:hypothetical protein